YSFESSSSVTSLGKEKTKEQKPFYSNFTIKTIAFQDNAFVLDIEHNDSTYRRYIKPNGEIKGAVSETGTELPVFLSFPDSDWKIGESYQISKSVRIKNTDVTAIWNIFLKSVNNDTGLAEIAFTATLPLPQDQLRKKSFSLNGTVIFNTFEGVVYRADWVSKYKFDFYNKEIAIIRNMWKFENELRHSLIMENLEEY
ncbi:MAG: hypothetical protein PHF29_07445, partial [Candidatus Riflebacteria bacterium]|nr:hypothetical protein [Candidatus Riflebacteria bacterium]